LSKVGHRCFVISSASGGGKTTLVGRVLEELDSVAKTISHTTRLARPTEVHGRDYFFVSRRAFEDDIQKGQFIEHAQVYGNLYGTSKKTIQSIHAQNKDAILVIENQGALELIKHFDHVTLILIKPPSLEVLRERLVGRAKSSTDDIQERLNQAAKEIDEMSWYQHIIINDDIEKASQELLELIQGIQLQS